MRRVQSTSTQGGRQGRGHQLDMDTPTANTQRVTTEIEMAYMYHCTTIPQSPHATCYWKCRQSRLRAGHGSAQANINRQSTSYHMILIYHHTITWSGPVSHTEDMVTMSLTRCPPGRQAFLYHHHTRSRAFQWQLL